MEPRVPSVVAEIVATTQLLRLSRAEYEKLVGIGFFQDRKVELLHGILVEMSPQGAEHLFPIRQLTRIFSQAIGDRAEVQVQGPLALSSDGEPEPDVALVPRGDYRHALPTTAFLIVEVADRSIKKDRDIKSGIYAAAGIPEYWLVDLTKMRVERYLEPDGGRYTTMTTHAAGESLAVDAFRDVVVPLSDILPL